MGHRLGGLGTSRHGSKESTILHVKNFQYGPNHCDNSCPSCLRFLMGSRTGADHAVTVSLLGNRENQNERVVSAE